RAPHKAEHVSPRDPAAAVGPATHRVRAVVRTGSTRIRARQQAEPKGGREISAKAISEELRAKIHRPEARSPTQRKIQRIRTIQPGGAAVRADGRYRLHAGRAKRSRATVPDVLASDSTPR